MIKLLWQPIQVFNKKTRYISCNRILDNSVPTFWPPNVFQNPSFSLIFIHYSLISWFKIFIFVVPFCIAMTIVKSINLQFCHYDNISKEANDFTILVPCPQSITFHKIYNKMFAQNFKETTLFWTLSHRLAVCLKVFA